MRGTKVNSQLLAEIRRYGKFDVSGCYNCGSCTVICNLVEDSGSFPRRSMQYGLLGLEAPLLSGLEPWLCYYCGDCSTTCPRQAEPAEAMMTLRRYLTARYDWTGLAAKIYSSTIWKIGSLLAVGFLVLLLFVFYHLYIAKLSLTDLASTSLGLEHMFGKISYFTLVVFLLPLLILASNALRMHRFIMYGGEKIKISPWLYLTELKTLILHTFTQRRLGDCTEKGRWVKHLLLFFGFVLMSVILIFFLKWFQTDKIYPLSHPQRWLGYLATFVLIYGSAESLLGRIKKREPIYRFSEPSDWTLPLLLLLTALSGIIVHILRYLGLSMVAHYAYLVHLIIAVPLLMVEIPFGKLAHLLYRPLAIYFQQVRAKALAPQTLEGVKEAA